MLLLPLTVANIIECYLFHEVKGNLQERIEQQLAKKGRNLSLVFTRGTLWSLSLKKKTTTSGEHRHKPGPLESEQDMLDMN